VAHHTTREGPLVRRLLFGRFAHAFFAFWFRIVRTRAMSRRTFRIWLVLFSCWVAFCMRRLNCARKSDWSSWLSSSVDFVLISAAVMSLRSDHPLDESRRDRQLRRSEAERFLGGDLVHAVHLVEDLARLDLGDPVLGVAL